MRSRGSIFLRETALARWAAVACCAVAWACGPEPAEGPSEGARSDEVGSIGDKPLAEFQEELLEIAYRAPSAMPLNPHVKNRSRGQEAVVATCLGMDQPRRALRYLEGIEDWRRGAAYADLAAYCAERGDAAQARRHLEEAARIAERSARDENGQAWRRDRIRIKIASAYLILGERDLAARFAAGAVDSEAGRLDVVRASLAAPDDLDEEVRALDAVLEGGSLDRVRHALEACAAIYDRVFEDEERRSRLEGRIRSSSTKLPARTRVEAFLGIADLAMDHGDRRAGLDNVEEARRLLEESTWLPEDRIPLEARLAALRHRGGEEIEARRDLDAALARYDAERAKIVDIYRAGALRPVAEAYQSIGDTRAALAVYRRAVEEGVHNPNSRPRADDLAATCRSMALHGVEPDGDLLARLLQICEGLSDPW